MGDRQKYERGVLKEGFLGKAKLNMVSQLFSKKGKNGVFLRWHHGYWVLRDSLLFEGYKSGSKSSKDLTKTFNLNHCENVNVCNFASSKKTLFAFRLRIYSHGATKEYLFSAESERERDYWVETIVDLCDLSPDDENYEWLDFNYTPNDRRLMTASKQEYAPPLPPIPWSMNSGTTLGPPEQPRMKPPFGMYSTSSGSAEELRPIGGGGSYGFLTTMNRSELSQPPLPPPHSRSLMSVANPDPLNSDDDSDIDEYEEGIFEPVHFPGQGGKGQVMFQPEGDNIVKASFSRSALERPPIRPPAERPPPVPAPKWTHPAERPPMPIPGEDTTAPPSSTPSHHPKQSPIPPSSVIKPMLARDPLVPVQAMRERPSHADSSQHDKQRPPPPPPTSAKPGQSKLSPPPLPVASKPQQFVQPPAVGGVPLPVPPRTSRDPSSVPQTDSPRLSKMSVPVSGRALDTISRPPATSDRPERGQPTASSPKVTSELERLLNKRRDVGTSAEPLQQTPDRQAKKRNEGKRPLTPPSVKSPTESTTSRTSQAAQRNKHVNSPPPPDVATKHWRHEEGTDDSGVGMDSGLLDDAHKGYYNTEDLHMKSPPRTTGHVRAFQRSFEEVTQTPPSPAPNFPTPSPSWSESSTSSPADNSTFSRLSDDSSISSGTLDGKSIFCKRPIPPRTASEPIYMNWPVPPDVQRELGGGSSSPSPPPVPVRRTGDDGAESKRKSKPVSRGHSAAAADRVPVNPRPVATRGGLNRTRSKDLDDLPEDRPAPNPVVSRKPPPTNKKPPPLGWSEQPRVGAKPTSARGPAAFGPTPSKDSFQQTRAGIADKVAMFQKM